MSPLSSITFHGLTFHGGRLDEAARCFPTAPLPWIDLSTGINPCPFPITAARDTDQRALPSRTALRQLEAAAAQAFGITYGAIAALPGSEIGLRLLATIGLPGPVRTVLPSYRSHLDAFPAVVKMDGNDLAKAAASPGTILLANPNNPDGRRVAPERLLDAARTLARHDGWLVIDEAFADAVDATSILPLLGESDPVLVLRSFGKFYGLAGIRLGFACGHPVMVDRIRHRLGDWPVSATAIALGAAAYGDDAWAKRTRDELTHGAGRLDRVLGRHGYDSTGTCPLFRLVATADAQTLFERLGRAGILTRPFDYAPTWLRFGLPADDEAFARLERALGDR